MKSWRQLLFESQDQLQQTGLPKKLIRHLIFSHRLGPGSRLLDASCGTGELVRYFAHLGLEATGFDESPETIAAAHDASPRLDFYCGKLSREMPCPEGAYSLVIARNLQPYRESLFSRAALRTTASLLSCVRPGGELVMLPQWGTLSERDDSIHQINCFEQQLVGFGGQCRSARFGGGSAQNSIQKFLGGGTKTEFAAVSLRIPKKKIARDEWLKTADRLSSMLDEDCCSQVIDQTGDYAEERVAA